MPDPKLKDAMEEIKAVLEKYDIGAEVILASETHLEYLHAYDPTWSCASIEKLPDGTHGIRVRAKLADFPDREAQKKCLEQTVGMFAGFYDAMEKSQEVMVTVMKMVGEVLEFEHITTEEPQS